MNLNEGKNLIKQKKFSEALVVFLNLKKQKNFDYKIYFYLGLANFELNNFNNSINYYEKFLKKEPHSISTLINLAIVKQTIGDLNSAKKIYKKIIQINKFNLRAYYGLYLLDEKSFSDNIFDTLLEIEKNQKLTLYDKGILNFLLSKKEKRKGDLKNEIYYLDKFHSNIFDSNKQYNNSSQFYYNEIASNFFDKVKIIHDKKNFIKNNDINPIFIIGLPRSGSTLVESILTSGSQEIPSFGESHIVNVSILDEIGPKIYKNDFNISEFNFELNLENINEKVIYKYSQLLKNGKKPIYTCELDERAKNLVLYPIDEIVKDLSCTYLNNTVAYAIAFALWNKVGAIRMYGVDFTYKGNLHFAESGRACVEFWLSKCMHAGIEVGIAQTSTLLDTSIPIQEKLYGYHRLKDPLVPLIDNDKLIVKKASELQYKRKTPDAMLIGRHDNKTSPVEPNKW